MSTPKRNEPCPCGSGKKYKQCCLKQDEGLAASRQAAATSLSRMLQDAIAYHQAGRLLDAEAIYQKILQIEPRHPEALHLSGIIAHQTGKYDLAIELIGKAINLTPSKPQYCNSIGAVLQSQGRLNEAAENYRKACALEPAYAEAFYNLGNVLKEQGKPHEAIASYRKALLLKPDICAAHHSLGIIFSNQKRLKDAASSFRKALALRPDYAEAHNNIGYVLQELGELDEAVKHYRQALALDSNYADAYSNLGNALKEQDKLDEAIECCRKAILLRPNFAEAHVNLGVVLEAQGKLSEAIKSYHQALFFKPNFAKAHQNLGNVFLEQGKPADAVNSYSKALSLNPNDPGALVNLANALIAQGNLDEAIKYCHKALLLKPGYAEAHGNIGNALKEQGRLDEAIERYRQALRLKPGFYKVHSNLLYILQFSPRFTLPEIFAEHKRFAEQFETPLKPLWPEHRNVCDPEKRLKVGYVSADFRQHAVALFIAPILANHDSSRIELFCYYNHTLNDPITERIRAVADHWIPCMGLSDAQLAERIVADGIDILVDLSGHTAGNRLLVFARKPAPIQVTYLGYPGTSGLSAMDYRITDRYANPAGSDIYYSEKLLRMPDSLWCYLPTSDMPDVGSLPALSNGYITFGSMNNFNKIDDLCIELWSALLKAIPTSRLLMVTVPEGTAREQLIEKFAHHGIPAERLELYGRLSSVEFHRMFQRVDITLDPLFVNGATSTCESLWMGVPVLTLVGERFLTRAGLSIMSAAGLHDFAPHTAEDYLRVARYLADNIPLLAEIHDNMRTGVAASPLADTATFTRNLEAAYRDIWVEYCRGDSKAHEPPKAQ